MKVWRQTDPRSVGLSERVFVRDHLMALENMFMDPLKKIGLDYCRTDRQKHIYTACFLTPEGC